MDGSGVSSEGIPVTQLVDPLTVYGNVPSK
jgi:hypothetical protein